MDKLKGYWEDYGSEIYITVSFVIIAFVSFYFGRLSIMNTNATIISSSEIEIIESSESKNTSEKAIAGSINGTKYYYSWCSGIKRINEENLIYFDSEAEAEERGYTKAKNCN